MNSNERKHVTLNNKGIAFITIIIAVAFVSIIGTALLYISYTNFQMKVLNLRSKENYYETDGELVKMSATLRSTVNSPEDLSSYITGLVDDGTGTGTKVGKYDLTGIVSLMYPAGNHPDNGDEYFYYVKDNPVRVATQGKVTTYTFEDLSIEQKSHDGYVNRVKTNLVFKVLEQSTNSGGSKGLGECSMINDSNVYVKSNSNFTFLTLMGDTYFSSYYYGGSPKFGSFTETVEETTETEGVETTTTTTVVHNTVTKPGRYNVSDSAPALELDDSAKINFEGNYLALYGDLVLKGNSVLNVSKGFLTVYGDIYILDKATLLCGGYIYQPKSLLPGRENTCRVYTGSSSGTPLEADENSLKKCLYYPHGVGKTAPCIAEEVDDSSYWQLCQLMKLDDDKEENDGITKQIVRKVKYKEGTNEVDHDILSAVDQLKNKDMAATTFSYNTEYYGTPCGVAFTQAGTAVSHPDDYANYLLFVYSKDGSRFDFKGSAIKTTMISRDPVELNVQDGVYFSRMGSDIYNYLTIENDDTENPYYDSGIHDFEINIQGNGFNSKGGNSYSAGSFLETDTNDKIINLFNAGVNGGGSGKKYINSATFSLYEKDYEKPDDEG